MYIVELKTDQGSVRKKQDNYLQKAKDNGIQKLINGLITIYNASSYKKKYDYLFEKLINLRLIIEDSEKRWIPIETDYKIEFVYILPNNESEIKDVITFENIIEYINYHQDNLTQRFIASLKNWQTKV